MMKTIAIPQALLNKRAQLSSFDTEAMDEAGLEAHNLLVAETEAELAKYGDHPMTPEEIAERLAEEQAYAEQLVIENKNKARLEALSAKWADPFALLDDVLERGITVVKAEREIIKMANPKGE